MHSDPLYLYHFVFLLPLLNGYISADSKLPSFYPSTVLRAVESSCVVLGFADDEATNDEVLSLLQSLADVSFSEDPSVIIGKLAPQIEIQSFWHDSQPLIVHNGLRREILNQSIFVFKRLKKDRTCLLMPSKQSKVPDVLQFDIFPKSLPQSKSTELLMRAVQEINVQCGTFRNTDGSLNFKGLHRNEILKNLFQIDLGSIKNAHTKKEVSHSYNLEDDEHVRCSKILEQSSKCDTTFCQVTANKASRVDEKYDECEKISIPSSVHFFHEYLSMSKPVVITGATDEWLAFKKWTKSFLKEKYGKTRVHIKATPDGEYEGVQHISLWEKHKHFHIPKEVEDQLPYRDLVVERPASLDMLFSEFLDLIENVSRGNTVNISAYLEYSSINDYFPELKSDIVEPNFISMLELASLNIWLSDGNTLGKLHFDPFDNLLCQISGEKHVTLFNPHHNERLYEGHIRESQFTYNKSTGSFYRYRLLDSTSMVMSPVDLKKPDLKRFPLFAGTRPLKCSIKAGEILFLPAFWWHEVQSRPNISEHRNLAVNFWYKPFLTKEFPCPECRLDVNPKYHHLL